MTFECKFPLQCVGNPILILSAETQNLRLSKLCPTLPTDIVQTQTAEKNAEEYIFKQGHLFHNFCKFLRPLPSTNNKHKQKLCIVRYVPSHLEERKGNFLSP